MSHDRGCPCGREPYEYSTCSCGRTRRPAAPTTAVPGTGQLEMVLRPPVLATAVAQETWDKRFLLLARQAAQWSKDPDEGVGAVVVSADRRSFSFGYNGFLRGYPDSYPVHGDKELKNRLTVHAERNALDNAPFDLKGATLYVTKPCCTECMKGLVQKGVVRVVYENWRPESRWFQDQVFALQIAKTMQVEAVLLKDCVDYSQVPGDEP